MGEPEPIQGEVTHRVGPRGCSLLFYPRGRTVHHVAPVQGHDFPDDLKPSLLRNNSGSCETHVIASSLHRYVTGKPLT
jgi:hypothetical protein